MKKLIPLLLLAAAACDTKLDLVCPAGESGCSGRCVALATDPHNCGACGAEVGPLGACVSSATVCAPDVGLCGNTCIDLARDPAHCGGCGVACVPGQLCTTDGGTTGCTATCPGGFVACAGACVELDSDRFHCGACGHACEPGERCRTGVCRPDLFVACYASNEVLPVTAALAPAGLHRDVPAGPTSLAVTADALYAANGYPNASVSVRPLTAALVPRDVAVVGSSDLQHVGVHAGVVMVSDASFGTLLFLSAGGRVLDEVAMPDQANFPNPRGFAVVGATAYVALSGNGTGNGQSVATVDLSGLPACAATPGTKGCGVVTGEIDLAAIPAAFDVPGLPFPSEVIAAGGKVYVALANLEEDVTPWGTAWVKPAGHGRLAVIDPGAANAVTVVDLGAACGNPGALALDGTTLWISCGSFSYSGLAPSALLPVDLSTGTPSVGTPLAAAAIVPGKLSFCGGKGYVTDQNSGAVVRFDPVAKTLEPAVTVCPVGPYGYAWASDVACTE